MGKILGLDLGVGSIGWAFIEKEDTQSKILGMGSRIIPLNVDENDEFAKGNAISKNQKRTLKRTMRKGYDRYQLRKEALKRALINWNMMPDKMLFLQLSAVQLYGLRDKALKEQISLPELGRILFHLNQKRGYKSSRKDSGEVEGKKLTDYEQEINSRFAVIEREKLTIGQYFYNELKKDERFRVKEKIFPRAAYISEFEAIWEAQQKYYPEILTEERRRMVRDEIIFYQRSLKSQKDLVSFCEFEGKFYKNSNGKEIFGGPKVAPRSSPLFQLCKVWESINTISIKNRRGEEFVISLEKKQEIFDYLDNNEKLTQTDLYKILGIGKNDGYYGNAMISKKGLQGNMTKTGIAKALEGYDNKAHWLSFPLEEEEYEAFDPLTGEVFSRKRLKAEIEHTPLYTLWHAVYSIADEKELLNTLTGKFSIPLENALKLSKIDFTKGGFGNKSAKAIRNLVSYLRNGAVYSDAATLAGYNHSGSITKVENEARTLLSKLQNLPKNSLRQPVVEKILNQLINLVNSILENQDLGRPDEIRIELARELKQSRDERNSTYSRINEAERAHDKIRKHLEEHPEFRKKKVTRRDIERYKLWEEFDKVSPYEPNKLISLGELFSGLYDIEHIIPKSLLFDDSFGNKTICPRHLNSGQDAKNQMTAFDFMESRSAEKFNAYLECINKNKKISKTKRDRLLMKADKIPQDFVARQLRETQYISRKAHDILTGICRNVSATSGSITEKVRRLWGWDDVLMNLHLPGYRELGKTEITEYMSNGQTHKKEVITGWSKRDDHRHHAIDALAIACTTPALIKRINTLSAQHTRDELFADVKGLEFNEKLSVLEKYIVSQCLFTVSEVEKHAANILISYKSGKKVATLGSRTVKKDGKRVKVQENVIVPRGPLSEESVYGKIPRKLIKEVKLNPSFTQVDSIVNIQHRKIIKRRLAEFNNDPALAFKSLSKNPVYIDDNKRQILEKVQVSYYADEYVIKYPVQSIGPKDLDFVVDKAVREVLEKRLNQYNNPKEAYKDLTNSPVWLNEEKRIPIRSVRCYTGLTVVAPIKVKDAVQGNSFEKYVKPGSNHHIAIYIDADGKRQEHVVTFWHAVERKKYGVPVIIQHPGELWTQIINGTLIIDNEEFKKQLPPDGWSFVTSMQQNELFVFNMKKEEIEIAISKKEYFSVASNLFRLRKITSGSYWFNHIYETQPRESIEDKRAGRCIQASLSGMKGIKVRLNNLGQIIQIGEIASLTNVAIPSVKGISLDTLEKASIKQINIK